MTRRAHLSLSVALQIWAISAIVPLALIFLKPFGRLDFTTFWIAGKMVLSGAAGQVYDPNAALIIAESINSSAAVVFPYPPHALLFFTPFAALPHITAYFAWNIATAGFFYWAARPWLPARFPPILVLLTPAALICLDFGQTGLLFGGLWLLAFRGGWPAVGLLSFKPHLALLSLFSLRDRMSFFKAALVALALAAICAILFGPSLWVEFVNHTLGHASEIGARKRWLFGGVSPAIGYGFWGWIPFAAAGALLLARNLNAFTAATASLLISPYGFHYDMPVTCLGFGLLIVRDWSNMPIPHRIPIALGFLSPVIALAGAWWVPPILLWGLWAQTNYESGGEPAAQLERGRA